MIIKSFVPFRTQGTWRKLHCPNPDFNLEVFPTIKSPGPARIILTSLSPSFVTRKKTAVKQKKAARNPVGKKNGLSERGTTRTIRWDYHDVQAEISNFEEWKYLFVLKDKDRHLKFKLDYIQ